MAGHASGPIPAVDQGERSGLEARDGAGAGFHEPYRLASTRGVWPNVSQHAFATVVEAAHGMLGALAAAVPMAGWVLGRRVGDDFYVVAVRDSFYGLTPGFTSPWTETLCSRVLLGLGPNVAPVAQAIDAFVDTTVSRTHPIESYVCFPLRGRDGRLLGMLSGLDPQPRSTALRAEVGHVELAARLLTTLLEQALALHRARRTELARRWRQADACPGAEAWHAALELEARRSAELGSALSVIRAAVPNGTEGRAAEAIRDSLGDDVPVASPSAAEVAALRAGDTDTPGNDVVSGVREALERHGIRGRVGAADWRPGLDGGEAYRLAAAG